MSANKSLETAVDIAGENSSEAPVPQKTVERELQSLPAFGWILFASGMVLIGTYNTSMRMVELYGDGKQPVSTPMSIFLIELLKFFISLVRYSQELGSASKAISHLTALRWRHVWPYGLSGLLYMLNNNLEIYILAYMDPASFRLLSNIKIITTAVLFLVVMKKAISMQQSSALLLLFGGAMVSSMTGTSGGTAGGEMFVTMTGLILTVVYAFNSAIASVSNEFMMKKGAGSDQSIHLQNCILYMWGLVFNAAGGFIATEAGQQTGFVSGAQVAWWLYFVLNGAVHGLVIAYMMKYLSSIWKLFMSAASAVFAGFLQVFLLGASSLSSAFLASAALVSFAIYMYSTPGVICDDDEDSANRKR